MSQNRSLPLLLSLTVVAMLLGCSMPSASSTEVSPQATQESTAPSNTVAGAARTPTVDPRNQLVELLDWQAFAFADRTAGVYLWINLNPTSRYEGTFLYAVEDAGLFWGDGVATPTSLADGSVEVRYDGLGWNDAIGTFDPLLWSYDLNGEPSGMQLELHAVLGANRSTATAELVANGRRYDLNDGPPIAGADEAVGDIAELVDEEDWRSLYSRIHDRVRDSLDETRFIAEMKKGTQQYGEIVSVAVTSETTLSDSGTAWDVGRARLAITFAKNGRRETYPVTVALIADAGTWWLSGISQINPDTSPLPSASGTPSPS